MYKTLIQLFLLLILILIIFFVSNKYFYTVDKIEEINNDISLDVEKNNLPKAEKIMKESGVYYENIGFTQKDYLEIDGELKISINDLFKINNEWYNNY